MRARVRPALLLSLLVAVCGAACMEDTGPLTQAPLTLRFSSEIPGAAKGTRVSVDGRTIADSLSSAQIDLIVDAGNHEIVVQKDCTAVIPAETLWVAVRGGEPRTLDFALRPETGLAVASEPEGLPIWLDGLPTGEVTPATLACLPPGSHTVRVSPSAFGQTGFAADGDTVKSIVLGEAVGSLRFDLTFTPRPQPRGVLLELFTSTYCPFCGPADQAATELDADPAFASERLSVTQIHLYWNGLDPLFNEDLGVRADYYRIEPATSPHAIFNGHDRVSGTLFPNIKDTYRARIANTYGRPAQAALYWTDARIEEDRIEGRLRFVAIEDLSAYPSLGLRVFYAKDSLRITDPVHNPNNLDFVQGAREYIDPIDLTSAGIVAPGSFLDLDVSFDLNADPLPAYIDSSAETLRLVAFVQDNASLEILQCRQVLLGSP